MKRYSLISLILLLVLNVFILSQQEKIDFASLRKSMVKYQIEARGIKDKKVLNAMLKVPRHLFVDEELRQWAYEDHPLPIDEGQTISQPFIVGLMTEKLNLKGNEKVLEIGTGSGYQAAILAEIVREVYTIEIRETLAKKAESTLKKLGYKNIKVKVGDGYLGWEENSPYDGIIVTCASKDIPSPLFAQLNENGRMIIPVEKGLYQVLTLIEKKRGKMIKKEIELVRFVPLVREKDKK